MAADAYLKVAAGQLQQGATELKREADQARADANTQRQQIERELTNLQASINVAKVNAARSHGDPGSHALHEGQVKNLQKQIDEKNRQLDLIKSQAEQLARTKESAMQGLKNQAQQLERQAGDPALRK